MLSLTTEQVDLALQDFEYFHNNVFCKSFMPSQPFISGEHINEWCRMLQLKPDTAIISARKHSKSITVYSYIMWEIARHASEDYEVLYLSYSTPLGRYHINKIRSAIRLNPFFAGMKNLTSGTTEGVAKYTWEGKYRQTISPGGILSFERGKHPDLVVLDDVLQDPANILELKIIEKINRTVREVIFSLPKEGGRLKVIGTAQTPADFLFDLKKHKSFAWGSYSAVKNSALKQPLWPERFSWERLMELRAKIGEKGFDKEYLIKPVWSADSYFRENQIIGDGTSKYPGCVNKLLTVVNKLDTKRDVGIGWDIGKHSHPAYVAAFEFVPLASEAGAPDLAIQRFFRWMDGWDYKRQLEFVQMLVENLRADYVNWDSTRGELEGFYEKGLMDKTVFFPFNFSVKTKNVLASEFEKRVTHIDRNGDLSPTIQLINDERSIRQILAVNNDLDAPDSHEGHGDSFWGIALALHRRRLGEFVFLQDPENLTGLK